MLWNKRHGVCFAPDGDPLLPSSVPPSSEPQGRTRKIRCEFCECETVGSGDYLKLSDKAKRLRGLEETNEKLEGTISDLRKEIETLRERIPASVPAAASSRSW